MYLPLDVVATWPPGNHVNPERPGPALIITHGIFFPLILFMLGIRLYTRIHVTKTFGKDDYLLMASLIPTAGFATLTILIETYIGWDMHQWDVSIDSIALGMKCIIATQVLFATSVSIMRLSMLCLVYRLFPPGVTKLRAFTRVIMAVVVVHGCIFCITVIFQCRPISDYWKLTFKPQTSCINERIHLITTSILNTVVDFIVITLPIPTVLRLQMPLGQRLLVALLFAAGFFASFASIIRAVYTYKAAAEYDRTWNIYFVFIWSSVELYLGLLCASIIPSTPFFKRLYPKVFGSITRSTQSEETPTSSLIESIQSGPDKAIPMQ